MYTSKYGNIVLMHTLSRLSAGCSAILIFSKLISRKICLKSFDSKTIYVMLSAINKPITVTRRKECEKPFIKLIAALKILTAIFYLINSCVLYCQLGAIFKIKK